MVMLSPFITEKNGFHFNNKINIVNPVLTTTSEQRPPVYNGRPDPQFYKIKSNLEVDQC